MNIIKLAFKVVIWRWVEAFQMLYAHRRTIHYYIKHGMWRRLRRHIFVTFFIRGEDCGKGVIDWVYRLFGWAPYLWDIEVEITTRCYLKCIHCEHTYFPHDYLNQDLSLGRFVALLESAPNLKWINLTGEGTPYLNKDFQTMLSVARSRDIYVDFSHEFHDITDEQLRQLVEIGVDRVYWSVDAAKDTTYESIRVGASWKNTIANVRRLIDIKREYNSPLPEICVRFAFCTLNIDEVPRILDTLECVEPDIKAWGDEPSLNIVALLEFDQTKHLVTECPPEYVETVNRRAKELGWKVYWSHVTHNENDKPPLDWCTFWSEPYVMITGHVVPCCGVLMSNKRPFLEEHSFGNINEQSLKDIWNSEKYRQFRKDVVSPWQPVPAICAGCRVFNTQKRIEENGIK